MKIPSTTIFAALVALTANPAVFAQDATEPVSPEASICIAPAVEEVLIDEPVIIECPGLDEASESVDPDANSTEPTGKDEEVVTEEPTDTEVVEITTEEEVSDSGDGGVPIEWVKRGGGELDNPDVIFYSMAGGPVLRNVTDGSSQTDVQPSGGTATRVVLNQGETAADIENSASSGGGVGKAAKKSTVAIVKQGRVFLR